VTVAGSRIGMPLGGLTTGPVLPGGRRREPGRVHHGLDAHDGRRGTQSIFALLNTPLDRCRRLVRPVALAQILCQRDGLGRIFLLDLCTVAAALFHLCVLSGGMRGGWPPERRMTRQ